MGPDRGGPVVQKLVRHLEMRAPAQLRPAAPVEDLRLVRLEDPAGTDAARIRALHDAIATPHLWSSLGPPGERWRRWLADPMCSHWIAVADDLDVGWACLTAGDDGSVEIASFGIRPAAVGRGYGGAFLTAIVRRAWGIPHPAIGAVRRVRLYTSSWDHPHALANYLARGFTVTRLELQEQHAGSEERSSEPVREAPDVLVRPAVAIDAPSVSKLVAGLGYERPVDTVRERLTRLASSPDDLAAVAVRDGTDVAGVITAHVVPMLAEHDRALLRITALSVAPHALRRGIARRLVEFSEYFGQLRGCGLIEISGGRRREREPAHHFYRSLGFEDAGTSSVRYLKRLAADPPGDGS